MSGSFPTGNSVEILFQAFKVFVQEELPIDATSLGKVLQMKVIFFCLPLKSKWVTWSVYILLYNRLIKTTVIPYHKKMVLSTGQWFFWYFSSPFNTSDKNFFSKKLVWPKLFLPYWKMVFSTGKYLTNPRERSLFHLPRDQEMDKLQLDLSWNGILKAKFIAILEVFCFGLFVSCCEFLFFCLRT